MKKSFITVSIGLFITLFGIASCKKKSDPSTHDKFVGTWKLHQIVFDDNGNGSIDPIDPVWIIDTEEITITFNAGGTGTSVSNTPPGHSFTWELTNNDTYLAITETGGTNGSHVLITSGPGSTFVVKDTASSPIEWETFVKQ